MRARLLGLAALTVAPALAAAQRQPVLSQIDAPHAYYFREMYLPQVTNGPTALAWSPDGESLVYAMQGSLWRQRVSETVAHELTRGPGYDHQPDWSPDGKWIVYASYTGRAVDLRLLDVQSGESRVALDNGAVNVEPRFSPDGKRVAFVSTAHQRRFHIFVADFAGGTLKNARRLTGETRTAAPRYYYSPVDHEISPAWSPDGRELVFVSNRGARYGSGGLWRMPSKPGARAREIHREETTWKARPDWSPDGKRLVYASYAGRAWHQLWLLPAAGGDAFPLTYGDFDATQPRWSPDGARIAYLSNQTGSPVAWIVEAVGGAKRRLAIQERRYRVPRTRLTVTVMKHKLLHPARVSITGADGLTYAPDDAWIHADDAFDRAERPFEVHYFHSMGRAEVSVPRGRVTVEVMAGFEHAFEKRDVDVGADPVAIAVDLRQLPLVTPWESGDVHVHMNYGGVYKNTPKRLAAQAAAEGLHHVFNLIVNKEQRIPDVELFDAAQEFHTSVHGHLGLLGLKQLLLPDYAGYPGTAAASLHPTNTVVADLAHAQAALVGYVHPFDWVPDPEKEALTHALPIDALLGKVDYLEVVGFSDHKSTAEVWYRLLDLGLRIPAAGGTDAMTNFASLRGPVGMNRTYVSSGGRYENRFDWLTELKKGRSFATNGPLLAFTLAEMGPGESLRLREAREVDFTVGFASLVQIDHLELVCNGKVVRALQPVRTTTKGRVLIDRSGWCLVRAWSDGPRHPILDAYAYATTSPIYVKVEGAPPDAEAARRYFAAWIRDVEASWRAHPDWNSAAERSAALAAAAEALRRLNAGTP